MKKIKPINIMNKFSLFNEEWTPKIIGELNGQHVKVCKLKDDFVWHSHENEDELFMVFKGTLLMDFRDQRTVEVREGEILIASLICSRAFSTLVYLEDFANHILASYKLGSCSTNFVKTSCKIK